MTKTTKNASTNAFASISETIEQVQSKMEVPAAARDFVKRTAGTAKERAESLHNGATDVATRAEKFTTAFVGGYANEAVQIQADYVRESARANFERAKNAAETARETVVEGAKTVQAEVSALYTKKAA